MERAASGMSDGDSAGQNVSPQLAEHDAAFLHQTNAWVARTRRHIEVFHGILQRRDDEYFARSWTRLDEHLDRDAYASICGEEAFTVAFPTQATSGPNRRGPGTGTTTTFKWGRRARGSSGYRTPLAEGAEEGKEKCRDR